MNINALNEDNLFFFFFPFFRKVLPQVPRQESHSGFHGLRSLHTSLSLQSHPFPICPQAPVCWDMAHGEDKSPALTEKQAEG